MSNNIEEILKSLPGVPDRFVSVEVSPQAEHAMNKKHPWLFRKGLMLDPEKEPEVGALIELCNRKGRTLGMGYYDSEDLIKVRVLQFGSKNDVDQNFFDGIMSRAFQKREKLLSRGTNGFRVINGESDFLPGVIIDKYDATVVMKIYTIGLLPYLNFIMNSLEKVLAPTNLILRLGSSFKLSSTTSGLQDGMIIKGTGENVIFSENGILFEVDPLKGQKTGFFLDQRDNRSKIESLAEGKKVLNLFSYTGGFSIYAARGGAAEIVSVDSSAPAIEMAKKNFEHNASSPRIAAASKEFIVDDVFDTLAEFEKSGRKFDIVIIDPPSFAKKQADVQNALGAYTRLTKMGLNVLERGGILAQASCSGRIKTEDFFTNIVKTANFAGRPLKIIQRTGHAIDHPVTFDEGYYLKCLFAYAL